MPSAVGEGEAIEGKDEEGRGEGGIKPRRSWGREPGKLMKAAGRRIGSYFYNIIRVDFGNGEPRKRVRLGGTRNNDRRNVADGMRYGKISSLING